MKKLIGIFPLLLFCLTSCTPSHDSMAKLNSQWSCDYVSFKVNKKWDFREGDGSANRAYGYWSWEDNDGKNFIRFTAWKFDLYSKMNDYEAQNYYESNKEPDDMKSESTFVVNNQAYVVVSKAPTSNTKKIYFYADKLHGCFEYAYYDEHIVKDIIKDMKFKSIS